MKGNKGLSNDLSIICVRLKAKNLLRNKFKILGFFGTYGLSGFYSRSYLLIAGSFKFQFSSVLVLLMLINFRFRVILNYA